MMGFCFSIKICLRLAMIPWLLFLCCPGIGAQGLKGKTNLRFVHVGQKQELAGVKPTCVFQDYYGFIWIGTWGGLYRFDGYTCRLFEHDPDNYHSLPSSFIAYHAFYEDADKDLWVATFDAGFVKFDRKTEQFKRFDTSPFVLQLNSICGDGANGVWVATRGQGLGHYAVQQDSFQLHSLRKNHPALSVGADRLNDVCRAKNGHLWIGTGLGLAGVSPQGHVTHYLPLLSFHQQRISADYILDVYEDRQNRIWACSRDGLNLLDSAGAFKHFFPEPQAGHPGNSIQRFFESSQGDYWTGTQGGLYRFDPIQGSFTPILHDPLDPWSVAQGGIHGIYEDRQHRLWFSADGGLCFFDRTTPSFYDENWAKLVPLLPKINTLYNSTQLAFAGNRYWIGNEKGLFYFQEGNPVQPFRLSGKPVNVTALLEDSNGKLYIGTSEGPFYKIDPEHLRVETVLQKETGTLRSSTSAIGLRNTAFAEDHQSRIWMGALGVLNCYESSTRRYYQFYHDHQQTASLTNSNINDLLVDRKGNLWVCTMKGVNRIDAMQLKGISNHSDWAFQHFLHVPGDANSISHNHVRVVFEDRRGWMWFGTDVGLNLLYPDGRWRRFFTSDGLPENHISGITEDRDGNMWVNTPSHGIAKYHVADNRFQTLDVLDGLSTNQFPGNAMLNLADGRLVFAGTGGLDVIEPSSVKIRHDSFPLYFTELKLFNSPIQVNDESGLLQLPIYMTDSLVLRYSQNALALQFAALNFTNPEKQVYRYRLAGFRELEDWQYIGHRRDISLTNLFPGIYTLCVESTSSPDNRAHWESGRTLIIIINPPWYGRWWAILSFGLGIFGVLYWVYKFRVRRKLAVAETRRLQELDTVKTELYTNITHEFRTPLAVILGETSLLEKQAMRHQKEGLAAIRRQAGQLLRLVNQMLDLAKVEAGSMHRQMLQTDVVLFLKYLLESFHSLAEDRGIRLQFESSVMELWMDCDVDKWQKIFSNLLSNALKFTPAGGTVALKLFIEKSTIHPEQVQIIVSDTGTGILPENLPRVFERFFQADQTDPGTGIGLALTKELVHLLGGSIRVDSVPMQGTVFTLVLPVTRGAEKRRLQQDDLLIHSDPSEQQGATAVPAPSGGKNRPRLLLVEDNPDVVRYIVRLLMNDYKILRADSGKEGLEMAFRYTPDIVISDVMMPQMDGFELCRRLKTDERTSHIPLILLTAKADQPSKIEGLEHGADAYLVKPFHPEELFVRIKKLIELRRKLQEHFRTTGRHLPGLKDNAPSLDEVFFEKVLRIVEENLGDETFDMPQLCKALHMSRSNLFRKIKALTGQSVTVFIRNLRLEKARDLLLGTDLNVTEVCFRVGFGSPNYFSRIFQETYGVSPSEIRKE
jgi:signal transduction histidine kinase/ligand-binding sensor domain-containing protein/DNA-binding response OmpR family regulator